MKAPAPLLNLLIGERGTQLFLAVLIGVGILVPILHLLSRTVPPFTLTTKAVNA